MSDSQPACHTHTRTHTSLSLSLSFRIDRRVAHLYVSLNSPPKPVLPIPPPSSLEHVERGVVLYLAGWAVRASLSHAYRHTRELLPALQQLLSLDAAADQMGNELKVELAYLESRELFGGLLRVRSPVLAFFVSLELELRSVLTMETLLDLREHVIQHAAGRIRSESLVLAFRALFDANVTTSTADIVRVNLSTRYLHSRAKSFRREIMQAASPNTLPSI